MAKVARRKKSEHNRWGRDAEKQRYWRTQLALWQNSGLSVRAFCKEHGVVETSFYAWRRELIIRAREEGSADELNSIEHQRNAVKDSRGRTIPIQFRQTDSHALKQLLDDEAAGSPFVPLTVVPDTPKHNEVVSSVELSLPGGATMQLKDDSQMDLIVRLLLELQKLKC